MDAKKCRRGRANPAGRDVERLKAWKREHRKDPAYRAKEAAKQRERMARIAGDAEVGRMARELFAKLAEFAAAVSGSAAPRRSGGRRERKG